MVTIQNYVRVKNLEEAYTLNQKNPRWNALDEDAGSDNPDGNRSVRAGT